jgi:hypothetical protein
MLPSIPDKPVQDIVAMLPYAGRPGIEVVVASVTLKI